MGEFLEFQEVLQEIRGAMVRNIERITNSASCKQRQLMASPGRSPRENGTTHHDSALPPRDSFMNVHFVTTYRDQFLNDLSFCQQAHALDLFFYE